MIEVCCVGIRPASFCGFAAAAGHKVACFGCSCVFVYPAFQASTEQGLPARRPCTRALSVIRLNHCT
ncbi:hypothetical protein, partial [Chimaeribacter arupi]|uniref:hypothetical protein n=1 Tax=Chimaeribacter arupi TaxID=2060066 RepID=UPI00294B682A